MLLAFGALRLGFLANFLSHPVISGFITASAMLIATGQVKHILGVRADGDTVPQNCSPHCSAGLADRIADAGHRRRDDWPSCSGPQRSRRRCWRAGLAAAIADLLAKAGAELADRAVDPGRGGLRAAGPSGRADRRRDPRRPAALCAAVASIAACGSNCCCRRVLISLVGFVESVSVAQTLALKRRQRIVPNQELLGLGRGEHRLGPVGRLSGDGRFCPLGGEF